MANILSLRYACILKLAWKSWFFMPDTNYFKNKITSFKSHFLSFGTTGIRIELLKIWKNALSDIDREIFSQSKKILTHCQF